VSNSRGLIVTRLAVAATATAIASNICTACGPADAFWPFTNKHKDQDENGRKRKKRQVAAIEVGLVPGSPPAFFWKPSGTPKAAVLCLHELGMHKGLFDDLGQRLAKQRVAVYAIDLRGFGGWTENKNGDTAMDLDKTLVDIKQSVQIMHKLNPDLPVFVLGEAMGGALALKAAAQFPDLIQGAISSAPAGDHYDTVSNYARVGVRLITNGPNGEFEKLGKDLIARATPKPELREALQNDADVRLDVTPKEVMTCQFFMYTTKKLARSIKQTPVMIVQGERDGETEPASAKIVYDNLATKDKKFLSVPEGDHYVFEDIKVDDNVLKSTLSWIDEHVPQAH
jgi:acylglycerol lipase